MKITYAPQAVSGVQTLMYVGDDPIDKASSKITTILVVGGFALGVMWLLSQKKR